MLIDFCLKRKDGDCCPVLELQSDGSITVGERLYLESQSLIFFEDGGIQFEG